MRRPRGITIVAVILALLGTFAVLFGVLAVVAIVAGGQPTDVDPKLTRVAEIVGVVYLVIGLGQWVVAWAMWHLKKWAWWLTVILQGISVLQALAAMAFTEVTSVDAAAFGGLILSAGILAYFLTTGVRSAFGYGPVFGQ